uniref:Uncharacterized protein LOC102806992 n=1 Tax=Saccoglossus kowalevskii TaxID=10224 RepID=A0ABM0MHB8_SACKO|nr:PREDICTED: uncharacterized protein LOC102806992 [Saccoglossus kowalevskii]
MITEAEPDTGKLNDNSSALIGGIVGAIVALIIVIVILVILILRHKGGNKPSDIELSDNHARDNAYEFSGVDNPSMDSHDITDTSHQNGNHLVGAIPQDIDQPAPPAATPAPTVNLGELYSQVQKKTDNTPPAAYTGYGKVNKNKKPKKDDGVTDVYAQPKKKPKKDNGVTDVYAQPKKKPKKEDEKKKTKEVDKKKNNKDKDKVPDKSKQPDGTMYANLPGSHSGTQDVPPFFTNGQVFWQ